MGGVYLAEPLRDSNVALSVVEEAMFSITTKQRVLALLSCRAPPPAVSSLDGLDETLRGQEMGEKASWPCAGDQEPLTSRSHLSQ
jgi:hypothetical protein